MTPIKGNEIKKAISAKEDISHFPCIVEMYFILILIIEDRFLIKAKKCTG